MSEQSQATPIQVKANELPLCCPTPDTQTWCLHPRVFLAFDAHKTAQCPYCGTKYQIVADVRA